jgi:hypothetical protein
MMFDSLLLQMHQYISAPASLGFYGVAVHISFTEQVQRQGKTDGWLASLFIACHCQEPNLAAV